MDLAEKLTGPLEEALTAAFSQVHLLTLGRSRAFITGLRWVWPSGRKPLGLIKQWCLYIISKFEGVENCQ